MQSSPPRIALFGGSFDPPHLAHRQIVEHLLKARNYDEVWIIPSYLHPEKKSQQSFTHRVEMCRLNFAPCGKKVKIIDIESRLSGYTIDLIRELQAQFPHYRFTFILGSDLKEQLGSWKEAQELRARMNFEFLERRGVSSSGAEPLFLPLSSSEIRRKLSRKESIDQEVAKAVKEYIFKHQLYRE